MGTTFNLPNFIGELFFVTPAETPFLAMIGGLSGGKQTLSPQFSFQTIDNNDPDPDSASAAALEGAAPIYESRSREQEVNVVQIFHYGVELSYTKQAAIGQLSGINILGNQPVTNENALQVRLKLERAARDVDAAFHTGEYAYPADNTDPRTTRGILTAIDTNDIDVSGEDVDKEAFDEMVRSMADNGAPFRQMVLLANSWNRQKISGIYAYAPEDRNYGGVSIKMVETDFTTFGVVYDRQMPADEIALVDVSVCAPVSMPIPGKGHFFLEPMAKTKSADAWQLYGEIGLEHGPEFFHGKMSNTSDGS